jgi:hypothetical protein
MDKTVTVKQLTNIWSWAPDGARHQDRQTDWPSVVMWLWLWIKQSHLHSQQVNAKSTRNSTRRLPASHSATALRTYDHRAGPPRNRRFKSTSPVVSHAGAQKSAKKTYDHPVCPPRKGLASSLHQRFIASGPFQGQQPPACPCNDSRVHSVSRTFDIPQNLRQVHPGTWCFALLWCICWSRLAGSDTGPGKSIDVELPGTSVVPPCGGQWPRDTNTMQESGNSLAGKPPWSRKWPGRIRPWDSQLW